jgi:hypothetical protein
MLKGFFLPTKAVNEPKGYAPNSPEKQPFKQLTLKCGILKSTPLYISEEIRTGNTKRCQHHTNTSGTYHLPKNYM